MDSMVLEPAAVTEGAKYRMRRAIATFCVLQAIDVVTTLLGLRTGAGEASLFVDRLLHYGPLAGLVASKLVAVILLLIALRYRKLRAVQFLNLWLSVVVTWNFVVVLRSVWT